MLRLGLYHTSGQVRVHLNQYQKNYSEIPQFTFSSPQGKSLGFFSFMIKPRLLLVRVHRRQGQYTQIQPVGKVYITLNLTAFIADTFFHCLFITAFHLYSPNLYIPLILSSFHCIILQWKLSLERMSSLIHCFFTRLQDCIIYIR